MKGSCYSMKEVKKLTVIQTVIDGKRTAKEASEVLKLSERQIWRLVKKIKEEGLDGIKHGNCKRTPKNKIEAEVVGKIIQLRKSHHYEDSNFRHFRDLLE